MIDRIKRGILSFINKEYLIINEFLETIKLPVSGKISHFHDIFIGMEESRLRNILEKYILRDHRNPINKINYVISVNAWPEIYRYVIQEGIVVAVIVEVGINSNKFMKIFNKIKKKLVDLFADSLSEHEFIKYPLLLWECSKHFCLLQVLYDEDLNINPIFYDYNYFGREIDGTFVRKPNKRFTVLPTIAIVFAKEPEYRSLAWLYLQFDLQKRRNSVAFLNMPNMFDK